LARRQAFILSDTGWASDVARLVLALKPFLPATRQQAPRGLPTWSVAGLALVALLAVGLMVYWPERPTGGPEPASVDVASSLAGRWEARVKYDWGAEHAERFELRVENAEVHGTAGYLGVARMIEQGRLAGGRLEFLTRTQETLGDGPGREVTHRYRGVLKGGELHFVLESGGGHSAHLPVEFVAGRPPGGG
jgi:hypothetical protein